MLPDYSSYASPSSLPGIAKKAKNSPKPTLVLDLDETLIHASLDPKISYDHTMQVKCGGKDVTVCSAFHFFRCTLA